MRTEDNGHFGHCYNNLGLFLISFIQRIPLKCLQSLGMQRIDLNKPDRFVYKKMYQRLGITPGGLKADNYVFQAFCQPGFDYAIPNIGKSGSVVVKFKWFDFAPVGTAAIPKRDCFTHINGHKKSFVIDKLFLVQSPS
jgi:hypothetical protein